MIILFDFDGVLVDSNHIKDLAFQEVFQKYAPKHIEDLLQFHKQNQSMSRHQKMSLAIHSILGLTGPEADIMTQEWVDSYAAKTRQAVVKCPEILGASELLQSLKKTPLYIASATPETELQLIVKNRGLEQYFVSVWGAPTTKEAMIEKAINQNNGTLDCTYLVGDSPSDWKAAQNKKIQFLGIDQGKPFPGFDGPIFKNLSELHFYLIETGLIP